MSYNNLCEKNFNLHLNVTSLKIDLSTIFITVPLVYNASGISSLQYITHLEKFKHDIETFFTMYYILL